MPKLSKTPAAIRQRAYRAKLKAQKAAAKVIGTPYRYSFKYVAKPEVFTIKTQDLQHARNMGDYSDYGAASTAPRRCYDCQRPVEHLETSVEKDGKFRCEPCDRLDDLEVKTDRVKELEQLVIKLAGKL